MTVKVDITRRERHRQRRKQNERIRRRRYQIYLDPEGYKERMAKKDETPTVQSDT